MISGDRQMRIIGTVLDGCMQRHKAIASNLANIETPGYKRLEVRFEEQLAAAVENGDDRELDEVEFAPRPSEGLPVRPDGNNVDFGTELGEMSKNTLLYSTFAQLAASRIRQYREAMGESS